MAINYKLAVVCQLLRKKITWYSECTEYLYGILDIRSRSGVFNKF